MAMIRFSKILRRRKTLSLLALALIVTTVSGCQEIGFYSQAIKGQYQIFAHQQLIDKLIADPQTPEKLRAKLQLIQQLRTFA